jgi:hypothetical protein
MAGEQKREGETKRGCMPFCSKCGTEVPENVNFCQKCGGNLQSGQNPSTSNNPSISDKWVWTLACIPILGMLLEQFIFGFVGYSSEWMGFLIFLVLNCTFVTLDINELKNKAFNPEGWIWLGFLLVPIYLFIRASKTNKKYGYAILWCVLFVLSLLL